MDDDDERVVFCLGVRVGVCSEELHVRYDYDSSGVHLYKQ